MKKVLSILLTVALVMSLGLLSFAAGVDSDHLNKWEREVINSLYPDKNLTEEQENRIIKIVRSTLKGDAVASGNYSDFEKRLYTEQWDTEQNAMLNASTVTQTVAQQISLLFSNHFSNKILVASVSTQQANYLLKSGLQAPVIYTYDLINNKYLELDNSLYSTNTEGTLTVDKSVSGYLIISSGELVKK